MPKNNGSGELKQNEIRFIYPIDASKQMRTNKITD